MNNAKNRRLVAAIACRNQGSRLYGKPVQNLDVENGISILDNILDCLATISAIDEIVLGISEGVDNECFIEIARSRGVKYIIGDERDVLSRLIQCGHAGGATDIFRVTSESPFLYFEAVEALWKRHVDENADATFLEEIIDGCGFEIISLESFERSHARGEKKHRSELCSLYIREHYKEFTTIRVTAPAKLIRQDLRLTVDNPEDLVVCRAVYQALKSFAPRIPVSDIVKFLDANPQLGNLIKPYTEKGYAIMYSWGKDE